VSGIVMKQPEGEFELTRVAEAGVALSVDELIMKMIAATGGEENLRRHKSRVMTADVTLEHQGLTGSLIVSARAPNSSASQMKIMAFGKTIATIDDYFDGQSGMEVASYAPPEVKAGKSLADERISADFYGVLEKST
jgi:hypothetical protein